MKQTDFFTFDSYREFLQDRVSILKKTKRSFSVRQFARKAGIGSPSYLGMVLNGKRKLSIDYADRFAQGLGLSETETECLRLAVAIEQAHSQKEIVDLTQRLAKFQKRAAQDRILGTRHVKVLSNMVNLKLYLLAQKLNFHFNIRWIRQYFSPLVTDSQLETGMRELLDSGLWIKAEQGIKTIAPKIHTGNELEAEDLRKTHEHLLELSKTSLLEQTSAQRVTVGRAFLCHPRNLPAMEAKIQDFLKGLEFEFEDTQADSVLQIHLNAFELLPRGVRK